MFKHKKVKLKTSFKIKKPLNRKKSNFKFDFDSVKYKKKSTLNKPVRTIRPVRKSEYVAINRTYKSNSRYLDSIIEGRYLFISVMLFFMFGIIGIRLFCLQIMDKDNYLIMLEMATASSIEGNSAPRGRIYDRNYKLIVDNKAINTIYYKKKPGISSKDEAKLAYKVASLIDVDYSKITDRIIKDFWCVNYSKDAYNKITEDERKLYSERKIDDNDIKRMTYERITSSDLSIYSDIDYEASYIYYLMNKGYGYAEKIIKNVDVSDYEYAVISENIDELDGFNTKVDWDRVYLYGDVFKSILGSVSSSSQGIPAELKDYYLKNGYSLDDRVGISYLEYQYEKYLRGTKSIYKVLNDNSYEVVSDGKRGNDIVLTIDIELQQYLENVLSEQVLLAKSEPNTNYFDHSFAIISDPNTGEILAMGGKQVVQDDNGGYKVVDYSTGIITTSVTPGSIVKGASILVGYKYGAVNIGDYMVDECIKIKSTPEKCSWKTLGRINDIDALSYSSNVYQYKIAMKVGGANYVYNGGLKIDESAFDKYRDMFASFGLGTITGIDIPNESVGYKGKSTMPGHLLDFAIGQYDNYTPIQINQYINTLANGGDKYSPYLVKEIYEYIDGDDFGDVVYKKNVNVISHVNIDSIYVDRVHEGFRVGATSGLAHGYFGNDSYNSAGKTGTSQSFIDTDGDGVVDTETISTAFVGYAPYDNPRMSIVVLSPNIDNGKSENPSRINRRITGAITNKYFELYG